MSIQTRKFWNTGDTITADKLTQMGVLALAETVNGNLTLNMTWQNAFNSMVTGIITDSREENMRVREYFNVLTIVGNSERNLYEIVAQDPAGGLPVIFRCSSPSEYPTTVKESDKPVL